MEDKQPAPKARPGRRAGENPVQRRARILEKWRLRQIVRSIPKSTRGRNVIRFFRYARLAASLSKSQRRFVVYPWTPRPLDPRQHPDAHVPRGSWQHNMRSRGLAHLVPLGEQ